jgi:hypothetical protein
MPLNISGYVDPGVYIGEVVTPSGISIATVPDVIGVVAHGNRNKRSINEAVKRGQVIGEAITLSGSSPYIATLIDRGDRRISNTVVRRSLSGETIALPSTALTYLGATLTGGSIATVNLTTPKAIGLVMDSGQKITIQIEHNAVPSVTVTGSLVTTKYTFATPAAATKVELAAAINAALAGASALGYGTLYSTAVSDTGTALKFTSPVTTPYSDVQVVACFANDGTATLGFTTPAKAVTILQVADAYYQSAASYEADYVSVDTLVDPLSETAIDIIRAGSFANVTSFTSPTDYLLTGGDIDWTPDTAAEFTGANSQPFDLSTNDTLRIAFDGRAAVDIDLVGLASPPPGYATPGTPATTTAAQVVNNINAVLSVTSGYGPDYRACAVVSGTKVKLISPTQGTASSLEIAAPSSSSATYTVFGLSGGQLPYTLIGTGAKPSTGVIYFITYEYARPTDDYEVPKRYFSEDQMIQDLTPVSRYNMLAVYGQIAFDNNAPSVVVCQVNDATLPGFPTVNEINSAIDGLKQTSVVTDVIVDDTRLNVQTYMMAHIENESSPTEKNYRCGWFGMAVGTGVGDKDTPDTFVYRAAVTLQVAPDSPARGRLFLVAPSGVERTITEEDGVEVTLTMDSTAVACAVAAKHTSFTSPAVSLASKNIVGFDATTFPTYVRAERAQLASNGVMVVTQDGGRLTLLDPVSTEAGGGKLPQFMFRSLASQKDNVTRAVEQAIAKNLQGLVPDDLADFIFDIKVFIASVLTALIETGAIGPFRDANGVSRDIDLSKDVQAEQSKTDPTKFFFRYFFFLRYPALRFFGQFSVDNPFWSA